MFAFCFLVSRFSFIRSLFGRLLRLHGPRYLFAFFLDVLGPLGSLFAALGALLAALGRSWAALGRTWVALNRSYAALGPLLADFHETFLKPTKKGGLAGAHTHAYARSGLNWRRRWGTRGRRWGTRAATHTQMLTHT